jgi:hypothetical protein
MQCAMDASVLSHACTGMWCLRECAPESNTGLIPDMGEIRPPPPWLLSRLHSLAVQHG